MHCTMSEVLSNSVPSQSKTMRSKWRAFHGARSVAHSGGSGASRVKRSPLAGWSKASLARVQEHAREAVLAGEGLVAREVAVLRVAHDGVAAVRQVDADLVRAAGLQRHVQQRAVGERLHHVHQRDRAPAVGMRRRHHAHMALAGGVQRLVQGQVEHLQARAARRRRPAPRRPCPCLAGAELVLQGRERAALLGQQQHARGFLVEPVHELQVARLRPRRRSCSMTPELTPLPPCTATPAGLSMASRCSSSNSTGNSRAGAAGTASAATLRPRASAARG